ncbi:MAG: class I SAM-dependent methyltransferase [Nanoarchaeota archaeon]|nr:class I SAM-dependent methyltransferase [Nanoarchaeota archaeon]MBU1854678.1 class I SAM-dependent methyltransferase [Nanoarchaeota archaeon]
MIILPVEKKLRARVMLEVADNVLKPSVASTSLLFAVKDKDIFDKTVFDIGSGTGYLGIGLMIRGANYLYATDANLDACNLTLRNAGLNNIGDDKFECKCGEYDEPFNRYEQNGLENKIDTIISNPPLMPSRLSREEYGPNEATSTEDGSESILKILEKAKYLLKKGGIIYFPIFNFSNPNKVKTFAEENFLSSVVATHDVIFDHNKLSQVDFFNAIYASGKGYSVEHQGHPYWRIEIMRCEK